jgi:hypothetical protein
MREVRGKLFSLCWVLGSSHEFIIREWQFNVVRKLGGAFGRSPRDMREREADAGYAVGCRRIGLLVLGSREGHDYFARLETADDEIVGATGSSPYRRQDRRWYIRKNAGD